ncbi:hypothetical protein N7468_008745 [Penicillium chermesinum]|uniref:Uncharacterized protein n=1 Tax=Penicillium chermesinum TaxID=63820 RepID=A0A9W9NGJ9_9EURO|nr:uncharacterized protein N7468_008745 [Penicillium chermesinum]KAJ5219541.1 hypothetical protein N7468_008745 [Penicillium chermesinum]KAJ6153561.1 hypothetical protein N7470_006520 [Penicillium chermesinum]
MKFSSVALVLVALVSSGFAKKTCTPSFDYCADVLISDKGFTEADLKDVLKGTDLENTPLKNVLFHCKNPGDVGHPKKCDNGCQDPKQEGSHSCSV